MIPGMDPRQMQQMMKRMGMKQIDIDATEVIIKTRTKDIIITNPQVAKIEMMGQTTYQVSGAESERSIGPLVSDDDVKMVADHAGVDLLKARKALEKSDGDLAEAILSLKD